MSQKKIEAHVYAGNVLDEHGNWVPLSEKVKSERAFLAHLEKGEIVFNGAWIPLSPLLHTVNPGETDEGIVDDKTSTFLKPSDETLLTDASEETINIPAEQLAKCLSKSTPTPETDFPPETAELVIECKSENVISEEVAFFQDADETFLFDGKTQVDLSINHSQKNKADEFATESETTEYDETVMFNIKSIQSQLNDKNKKSGNVKGKNRLVG
jgi:hypothetical protein